MHNLTDDLQTKLLTSLLELDSAAEFQRFMAAMDVMNADHLLFSELPDYEVTLEKMVVVDHEINAQLILKQTAEALIDAVYDQNDNRSGNEIKIDATTFLKGNGPLFTLKGVMNDPNLLEHQILQAVIDQTNAVINESKIQSASKTSTEGTRVQVIDPDDDYAGLVGTISTVISLDSPDHESGNNFDDVVVDLDEEQRPLLNLPTYSTLLEGGDPAPEDHIPSLEQVIFAPQDLRAI